MGTELNHSILHQESVYRWGLFILKEYPLKSRAFCFLKCLQPWIHINDSYKLKAKKICFMMPNVSFLLQQILG